MGHRLGKQIMKDKFDILVVGGGCIGSSILFALASRGEKHIGLVDSGRRTTSATANSGGMIRMFHENPQHTELAIRSSELLEKYRRDRCIDIDVKCNGNLYFFDRSRYKSFETSLSRMDDAGCCYEVISAIAGRKIFPEFLWNDDDMAVYESTGKHVDPLALVDELLSYSQSRSAQVFDDSDVLSIAVKNGDYQLILADRVLTAKKLILAGGARMLPLLATLDINLPLESKEIRTTVARASIAYETMPNYFDRETLDYARFGGGDHVVLSSANASRLKLDEPPFVVAERTANDCYAPNRVGLIVSPSNHRNITVVSGWGGTAFKFALEIGRRTSDVVTHSILGEEGIYASCTP